MSSQKWPTMSWHLVTAGIFTSSHCSRNWLKGPLQRENQFLWTYPWCSVNMFPLITSIEPLVHGKLLKNDVSWISRAQMLREQRLAGGGKKGLQCAVTFLVVIQFSYIENTERERGREREKKERERERRKREIDLFLWILSRILLTE